MRVIAGTARSLPLKTPEGMDTRPTTDRIKRNSFNILQTYIPDCGIRGYFQRKQQREMRAALSRGARKSIFYRKCRRACIEDNLAFTKMKDRAIVLKQDACARLTGIYEKTCRCLIFMDPPYDRTGTQDSGTGCVIQICIGGNADNPQWRPLHFGFFLCESLGLRNREKIQNQQQACISSQEIIAERRLYEKGCLYRKL